MRTRLCTILYACVAAVAVATAQRPESIAQPTQPTFRAGTNYVRVDMYATQRGVPIDDLRPEEIELREDGVVQKLETFERIRIPGAGPEAQRVEPSTVAESRQAAADSRARVFVVFLDTLHTQIEGSMTLRIPLVRFIDRLLGPDDLVALMTPEMSARDLTFGRKTTVISNIMQTRWDWGRRNNERVADPREALYDRCYYGDRNRWMATAMKARRRERLTFDALEDLVTVLGGLREERKAVLTVSQGWPEFKEDQRLASAPRNPDGTASPPGPDAFGRMPRQRTEPERADTADIVECESDRMALARMDDSTRLQEIGGHANRANVSFYTVDPEGLSPGKSLKAQAGLRYLADTTDGIPIVNTNEIDKGIERIVADLSSYYLVSYYSTNAKSDGRFRTIGVKVLRPGVQVRARRGYRAPTPGEPLPSGSTSEGSPILDRRTEGAVASRSAGGTAVVDAKAALRLRGSSWTAPTSGSAVAGRLWLVAEVDYRVRRELAWTSGADADVTVDAPGGATIASKMVDMPLADAFALAIPDSGTVEPGEYVVRVRLRAQSDSAQSISGVIRVLVPQIPTRVGEAVLWRRGPATGPKYLVTADPRFVRRERIRLEFPTRTTMPATAKLLERSGKAMTIPVQVSERVDAGSDFHWIVVEAALAPLAAGDYAIEVTADDARLVTPFKVIP